MRNNMLLIIAFLLTQSTALRIRGGRDVESEPPLGRGKETAASASALRSGAPSAGDDEREAHTDSGARNRLLVVGSVNLDIIVEVARLPVQGENVLARSPNAKTALGGKGANQAVAAARLSDASVDFVCQFGNDVHAERLERTLAASGVGLGACGHSAECGTGQGLVFLEENGNVSAVVVGGSNEAAWTDEFVRSLGKIVRGASALLLQREIPEKINERLAEEAHAAGVPVLLDVGGADRPIKDELLRLLSYISPNESELSRLTSMPTSSKEEVIAAAKSLQSRGAPNVLVTLGESGSLLLTQDGSILQQQALPVPGGKVIDTTGAGDAFRAAFAIRLTEGTPLTKALAFAAAAGAIAVSRLGAEPSLPTRAEAEALLAGRPMPPRSEAPTPPPTTPMRAHATQAGAAGGGGGGKAPPSLHGGFDEASWAASEERGVCPLEFGSRLNSMKARPELWEGGALDTLGLVARQGSVRGLNLVDFNYPQHLRGVSAAEAKAALDEAGLKAGAVCMRYEREHQAGALTHPDEAMRTKAIQMTIEGGKYALELGANELVIWSAFDGYDYHHQVDYTLLWSRVVSAFREICDALPEVRVSLEFKPTDENTRMFAVPSTGAALLLAKEVDRPNFGLTLDIGHMLMAGENPAQSVALVGGAGKLFGVQLNDGHAKLGAEDGLMFGSVHTSMALEFIRWLQKVRFDGHIYFDTFPRNEDPVREAEYNIRRVKALWNRAAELTRAGLDEHLVKHDAMAALELFERLDQ